jgi:hypothetical protein
MQGEARDDRRLRRIIALLVSLAGLAEQAAGRCYPLRFIVLLVLRRAQSAACDYVADAALLDGLWFDDGMQDGCRPEDAVLLGQRFRWLAAVVAGLLSPAGQFGGSHGACDPTRPASCRATPGGRRLAAPAFATAAVPVFPDTS